MLQLPTEISHTHRLAGDAITTTDPSAAVDVTDPATGQVIARIPAGTAAAAEAAVRAARAAAPAWARRGAGERAGLLKAGARRLREHAAGLPGVQERGDRQPPHH